MTGELVPITVDELRRLTNDQDPALIEYARFSSPLLAGLFGDSRICVLGLVPEPALSNRAYMWFDVIRTTVKHNLPPVSARAARRFIMEALKTYSAVVGHCNTPVALRWWAALGATFTPVRDEIFQFEIRS